MSHKYFIIILCKLLYLIQSSSLIIWKKLAAIEKTLREFDHLYNEDLQNCSPFLEAKNKSHDMIQILGILDYLI